MYIEKSCCVGQKGLYMGNHAFQRGRSQDANCLIQIYLSCTHVGRKHLAWQGPNEKLHKKQVVKISHLQ